MKSEVEERAPKNRTSGGRRLVPALAGLFAAALLVLGSSPTGAEGAVRGGFKAPAESAAASLEKQAEEIEAKLAKTPGDESLMANLTRTRINAANALIADGAGQSQGGVEEERQQLDLAREDWSEYLKVAKKPSPGLAIEVAPALFLIAELSSNDQEALENVKAAAAAEKIVTESRPSQNSWSTFAFYELFAQNYKAADEAIEKATRYAKTKREREAIEGVFGEVEKDAKRFGIQLKHGKRSSKSRPGLGGTFGRPI